MHQTLANVPWFQSEAETSILPAGFGSNLRIMVWSASGPGVHFSGLHGFRSDFQIKYESGLVPCLTFTDLFGFGYTFLYP